MPTDAKFTLLQEYNALDCCVTRQIFDALSPQLNPAEGKNYSLRAKTYNLSRALQAPALEMMLRGFTIDTSKVSTIRDTLIGELNDLKSLFSFLYESLIGSPPDPKFFNSPTQLKTFLCSRLGATPITLSFKGVKRETMNREALEKLKENEPDLTPIISIILSIRDRLKDLSTLKTGIDADKRIRSSFVVAGTKTGRWASRKSAWHSGTNLQNITEHLRKIFISDPEYKLCNIDLEQADSRNVALEVYKATGDDSYFRACIDSDLHTTVAKMVWPELAWTDDALANKKLAETPFYRHYDYRFMCKKLGHGSNYLGKPWTLARQSKIEVKIAEEFQDRYFSAFPGIPKWHRIRIAQLQQYGTLTSLHGRVRQFHGRLTDDATAREAIAFLGQSPTADSINLAILALWSSSLLIHLLAQVHDSIVFQYPISEEAEILPRAMELMSIPITATYNDKSITHAIPCEAKIGWNWGNFSTTNPDGLIKWRGNDNRIKSKVPTKKSIMDTKLSDLY